MLFTCPANYYITSPILAFSTVSSSSPSTPSPRCLHQAHQVWAIPYHSCACRHFCSSCCSEWISLGLRNSFRLASVCVTLTVPTCPSWVFPPLPSLAPPRPDRMDWKPERDFPPCGFCYRSRLAHADSIFYAVAAGCAALVLVLLDGQPWPCKGLKLPWLCSLSWKFCIWLNCHYCWGRPRPLCCPRALHVHQSCWWSVFSPWIVTGMCSNSSIYYKVGTCA